MTDTTLKPLDAYTADELRGIISSFHYFNFMLANRDEHAQTERVRAKRIADTELKLLETHVWNSVLHGAKEGRRTTIWTTRRFRQKAATQAAAALIKWHFLESLKSEMSHARLLFPELQNKINRVGQSDVAADTKRAKQRLLKDHFEAAFEAVGYRFVGTVFDDADRTAISANARHQALEDLPNWLDAIAEGDQASFEQSIVDTYLEYAFAWGKIVCDGREKFAANPPAPLGEEFDPEVLQDSKWIRWRIAGTSKEIDKLEAQRARHIIDRLEYAAFVQMADNYAADLNEQPGQVSTLYTRIGQAIERLAELDKTISVGSLIGPNLDRIETDGTHVNGLSVERATLLLG